MGLDIFFLLLIRKKRGLQDAENTVKCNNDNVCIDPLHFKNEETENSHSGPLTLSHFEFYNKFKTLGLNKCQ